MDDKKPKWLLKEKFDLGQVEFLTGSFLNSGDKTEDKRPERKKIASINKTQPPLKGLGLIELKLQVYFPQIWKSRVYPGS